MTRQRQILVTVTYNDLGCIIDTKAEPYEEPNLQPTCNNLATDTISRRAAIDAILAVTGNSSVRELYEHVQEHGLSEMWSGGVNVAIDTIIAVPSAQPEQSNASELWRKRADFYSDMCMNLIGEMGKGVKIESVKISENGIEFIKEQPPVQPEIIHCGDCIHWINKHLCEIWSRYGTIETKPDFYCGFGERINNE